MAWFRKAAEQGYANAQSNLGVMYNNGRGITKDEAQAVAWFRKAAEQGDANAKTILEQLESHKVTEQKNTPEQIPSSLEKAAQTNATERVTTTELQFRDNGIGFFPNENVPFTGRSEAYYPNGQKKAEVHWKDGKKIGLAIRWYENGQKSSESQYIDNKDSRTTDWDKNGHKTSEMSFIDGHQVIVWYENGQKKREAKWNNDTVTYTEWDENGKQIINNLPPNQPPQTPDNSQIQKEKTENVKADDAKCREDLQCWGTKYSAVADAFCEDYIEKLSTYNSRWTDGFFGFKFSRFSWLNKEKGTITYRGDKIEFQNSFGAYQNHIYECDLDTKSQAVLAVRAYAGRLP